MVQPGLDSRRPPRPGRTRPGWRPRILPGLRLGLPRGHRCLPDIRCPCPENAAHRDGANRHGVAGALALLAAFSMLHGTAQDGGEPVIRGSAAWLTRVGAADPAQAGLDDPSYGAESNPTGEPIGGGTGYKRIVRPSDATAVVSTADDLLRALARAESADAGTVIYVADDACVDLTAHSDVHIPGKVTLASGRGRDGSEGALLYTHTVKSTRLFRTAGPDVRITGLRLEGSHPGRERLTQRPTLMGIYHPNVEVDNCEIFAWSCAAVGVGSGAVEGAWVHHNYIHHNQRAGLGYGVSLGRTHVLIEGNLFDFCRHAIASSGVPHSGYTARYNVHLENTISHVFDMHGARDFEKYKQVGLWHLDEGKGVRTNDSSIYNGDHDGALHNMGEPSWVEGRIGNALRFDGEDDYADMGKGRQLSPGGGLTVSAWVRPDSVSGTQAVVSKADTGTKGSGYSLRLVDAVLEGVVYSPDGERRAARAGTVAPGEWQHVAMTWEGKQISLYVGGQRVGGLACDGRKTSGNHLVVGRDSATATSHFRGTLDELRLYNRAMAAADIQRQARGHGDISGRLILMHHNTIRATNYPALTVRGRPSIGCWVHHNRFYSPKDAGVVTQHNATGNFHVSDNQFLGLDLRPAPDFAEGQLFGHWTFDQPVDGTVRDLSGRGRDGTVAGDSPASAWTASGGGMALALTREGRSVEIPKAADGAVPERIAIGMRMRMDFLGEHQVLLDNGLFRFYHRGAWAGHRIYFLCRIGGTERSGQSSWGGYAGVRTRRGVKEGEWFEVVGERDGDVMRVYLDGMLEGEEECLSGYAPASSGRGPLRVGGAVDSAIDDLWIRSAVRPGEDQAPAETPATLFVTGEEGHESDGVAPDSGTASTLFRFRVLYRDVEGRPPAIGFPRVHVSRDGQAYLNEAPVSMLAVNEAPFDRGRVYTYTMRLPRGNRYAHRFEAETAGGKTFRTAAFAGPDVVEGSTAPVLSWTSQSGYGRDGAEPEIGDVSREFDFRILFSDLDGDQPMAGCPRLHVLKGKIGIRGSPFSMQPMGDRPTWQGRPYRFRTRLAAGSDYSYHFTASDVHGNVAPRTLTRRGPIVDPGKDVAPPDLSGIRATDLAADSATIRWETDEPATSGVDFGGDPTYGRHRESSERTTEHAVRLDGLIPGTAYHFRVNGTDEAGNLAQSGDYVFRTPGE